MRFNNGIVHVAAREHVSECMPYELADPQLSLRAAAWPVVAMVFVPHCSCVLPPHASRRRLRRLLSTRLA
jgi:hypothetical protein